jgi:hypothetical protein
MKTAIIALSLLVGSLAHAGEICDGVKAQVARQGWASVAVVQKGHAQRVTFVKSSNDCFDSAQEAYQVKADLDGGCYLNICANDAFSAGQWETLGWRTFLNP